MLLVVSPLPLILGSVAVEVDSFTVSFVIDPLSVIYVAINVNEFSPSVGFILMPLTFIHSPVRPNLHAIAFFFLTLPLPIVLDAITKFDSLLPEFFLAQLLLELLALHILTFHRKRLLAVIGIARVFVMLAEWLL